MGKVCITLPPSLTEEHLRIALKYFEKTERLTPGEWKTALETFDVLTQGAVAVGQRRRSFQQIYEQLVDARFADEFITALLEQDYEEAEAEARQQETAFAILALLEREGLYQDEVPGSEYLAAYCLYWWTAFARGYRFEVAVFRDLRASGISYRAHDLRQRAERRSSHDLVVLRQLGDIKNTTYFLHAARTRTLRSDFYITRLYHSRRRHYLWVVLLTETAWRTLDGEVTAAALETAVQFFPQPVQVLVGGQRLVIVPFNLWKAKVKKRQQEEE